MQDNHYLVPVQTEGIRKDLEHTLYAESQEDAEEWFVEAKNRLLDVNHWKNYSENLSAEFRLTDPHGKEVNRKAHRGDHLRITIPGPASVAGEGYDWVHVEAIEYDDYPDEDRETLAMRVRPSANPQHKNNNGTAHFFGNDATSTFVIERNGKRMSALYHGRNEVANTEDADVIDKVRNTSVALGAWLGLSDVQWSGLIKGLLEC